MRMRLNQRSLGFLNGATPLMLARAVGSDSVAEWMIAHGAQPDIRDVDGHDAAWHADPANASPLAAMACCKTAKAGTDGTYWARVQIQDVGMNFLKNVNGSILAVKTDSEHAATSTPTSASASSDATSFRCEGARLTRRRCVGPEHNADFSEL